jgi:hypothetical protein
MIKASASRLDTGAVHGDTPRQKRNRHETAGDDHRKRERISGDPV